VAPFPLPHSLHGSGAHRVIAVHGWFADRSAYDTVRPDLDGQSFTCFLRGGHGVYAGEEWHPGLRR
jgi:hypothetical protein